MNNNITKLSECSGEELAMMLNSQYLEYIRVKNNIENILKELYSRPQRITETDNKEPGKNERKRPVREGV